MTSKAGNRKAGTFLIALAPYLWLMAFFLVPGLIVFRISLSQTAIAQPPYVPIFDIAAGWSGVRDFWHGLSLDNYLSLAGRLCFISRPISRACRSRRSQR